MIYQGIRDKSFKDLILAVLARARLGDKVSLFVDDAGMAMYASAFTHSHADPVNNYEIYEYVGDSSANNAIVWYMFRKFPQLHTANGVYVFSVLKQHYSSKKSFFRLANELGFWPYITALEADTGDSWKKTKNRFSHRKDLLEDAMEAFFGVTSIIADRRLEFGVGNAIIYNIVKSLFDEFFPNISLRYTDVVDAKTRVKEIFDVKSFELGSFGSAIEGTRSETAEGECLHTVRIYGNVRGARTLLGTGVAALQEDAEQRAATQTYARLHTLGFKKPVPEIFRKLENL
jgi:dsRNA-specific ribonuclease